jgi:DNA-binding response OmpR family regulator
MVAMAPARALVLVVEDDPASAHGLIDTLESAGYRAWHAANGHEARQMLERMNPELILLDLTLPDVDGLVLCSQLKSSLPDVPIVVCSFSSRRGDPFLALKLGADDFVRRPFDADDLMARIEAVLRRVAPRAASPPWPQRPTGGGLHIGRLSIDNARRKVRLSGVELSLTPTELRLLAALAARPRATLSRYELAQQVWGYPDASHGRTIDVHIRRLRVKLAQAPGPAPAIVSVRGMGYRITEDEAAFSAA